MIYTLPENVRGFISVVESLFEEEQTIPLLTAKILNENWKNAMFKPQDLGLGYNATSNRGRRGGQSNGRVGFSGGDRSYDGPPAAEKPRYNGSLCYYCQPRGFIATHPFAECRKPAHAVKRESANTAVSRTAKPNSVNALVHQSLISGYQCSSSWHQPILIDQSSMQILEQQLTVQNIKHLLHNVARTKLLSSSILEIATKLGVYS
jgi:hypothetical protein